MIDDQKISWRNINLKPISIEDTLQYKTSIEEIELKWNDEWEKAPKEQKERVPKVPMGFCNDEWNTFKSHFTNNDEIWFFNYPNEYWKALCGSCGYVIVRNGKVIETFIETLN